GDEYEADDAAARQQREHVAARREHDLAEHVGAREGGRRDDPGRERTECRAVHRWISVPAPRSVRSSSSTACSTLPSRMTTPSTPASSAYMQVSTFGIIPPEMVPSAISRCASATDRSLISCFDLSSTPGTSVSSSRRFALSAPAIAPAKV